MVRMMLIVLIVQIAYLIIYDPSVLERMGNAVRDFLGLS